MSKFCFVCGKKTDRLKEGYCKECYNKKTSLIEVPKKIEMTTCKKCGFFKIKNNWEENRIKDIILDHVKFIAKKVEVEITKKNTKYEVIATNGKEEMHEVYAAVKSVMCPICARAYSDYYEAILQIRGNYTDRIVDFISEQLYFIAKKDRKAFYTATKVRGGIDLKIGSKFAAHEVSEIVRKKYGCQITKSFILVSKREGRDLYRNCISMRF